MKINNQKGMALVQVIIVGAVSLIVVLGMASMVANVFKAQRATQSKDASLELIASIRLLLADPQICNASFAGGGPVGSGFSKTQIVDAGAPANIKFQTGVNYLNNLVTLSGLDINNYTQDSPANPKVGKADLVIKMSRVGSTVGGAQLIKKILLQVTLDPSNNISLCQALGSKDSLWQMSPSNMNDIYYLGGNVGIGTNNPTSTFYVEGAIRAGSAGVAVGGSCTAEGTFGYDLSAHSPVFCNSALVWAKM